jgi:hypothetical protein
MKSTALDLVAMSELQKHAPTRAGLAAAEGAYKVKNLVTGEYIEEGKWMAVWVNVDGTWRVARLMSNTDAPVRAPVVGVDDADGE